MTLLDEIATRLGALLLPIVAGLLVEEMTLGGLVRLLITPWPRHKKQTNHPKGETKCSH